MTLVAGSAKTVAAAENIRMRHDDAAKLPPKRCWCSSLALPLVAAVLVWVAGLLRAMGDEAGATAVGYVGTACQVIWLVSLVGLLVTLARSLLSEPPTDEEP